MLARLARTGGSAVLALLLGHVPAAAQQATPPPRVEVETDSDPTRPVFVSVRPEFFNFEGQHRQLLIGRYDTRVRRAIILRVELPLVRTEIDGHATAGLGDLYAQFLVVPYGSGRFALVTGSGFILRPPPTNWSAAVSGCWPRLLRRCGGSHVVSSL